MPRGSLTLREAAASRVAPAEAASSFAAAAGSYLPKKSWESSAGRRTEAAASPAGAEAALAAAASSAAGAEAALAVRPGSARAGADAGAD